MPFIHTRLEPLAHEHSKEYLDAQPFPHLVLDDVLDGDALKKALHSFPSAEELESLRYDEGAPRRLAENPVTRLPVALQNIFADMQQSKFVRFLEALTGHEGLIPDPHFKAAGVHALAPGETLGVHVASNIHPQLKLQRQVSVYLFLNEGWEESFGGNLQLWSGDEVPACEARRIIPAFNRMVIMSCTPRSFHGFPTATQGHVQRYLVVHYYTSIQQALYATRFFKAPELAVATS